MPDREHLVIRLRVDGTIQAETKNVPGDACVPFAGIIEDLCDAEAIESDYTSDYYVAKHPNEQTARSEQRDNP